MFLSSVITGALSAAAGPAEAAGQGSAAAAPEFYLWQQFIVRNGTQPGRVAEFLQKAAVPALNRLGHKPVGAFEVVAGVPGPSVFLLVPLPSLDSLRTLEGGLQRDQTFVSDGRAYLDAPATDPAFTRQEASLLSAFPQFPRVEVPPATATGGPRLFELRIYESPSERAHLAKVRMFAEMGEIDIFRRVGLRPVFFARTLVGPRMPNLTYMLVHDNMAAREKSWDAFRTDPEWKKLSQTPGYRDAEIVSNITTIYLRPASYSQV